MTQRFPPIPESLRTGCNEKTFYVLLFSQVSFKIVHFFLLLVLVTSLSVSYNIALIGISRRLFLADYGPVDSHLLRNTMS